MFEPINTIFENLESKTLRISKIFRIFYLVRNEINCSRCLQLCCRTLQVIETQMKLMREQNYTPTLFIVHLCDICI